MKHYFLCLLIFTLCVGDTFSTSHTLAIETDDPQLLFTLGTQMQVANQEFEAIPYLQKATTCFTPADDAYFYLGHTCLKAGLVKQAIDAYAQAVRHNKQSQSSIHNYAYALKCYGQHAKALSIYKYLTERIPDYEAAHLGLAFGYMSSGDFEHAWPAHDWNLQKQHKYSPEFRTLIAENNFNSKRILLTMEGGFGDTIQFMRYTERIKKNGGYIIVVVQEALIPLIRTCPFVDEVHVYQRGASYPAHDARATLMSLPALFRDTQDSFPTNIPYLHADPALIKKWQPTIPSDKKLKIGICWQADVHNDVSRLPMARRGIPLGQFYRLRTLPNITWYSLQKREGLEQLKDNPADFNLHLFDASFDEVSGSFMDTAAVMMHLDLIITADSAVAHLAGALGRPVWLLLPYQTDWRWTEGRTDSAWYPSMRIFKQPRPFDWHSVMSAVAQELQALI